MEFETLRAEPIGFGVHLLHRSDTVPWHVDVRNKFFFGCALVHAHESDTRHVLSDQDPARRVRSMSTMRVSLAQLDAKHHHDLNDGNAGCRSPALEIPSPSSERDAIEHTPLRFWSSQMHVFSLSGLLDGRLHPRLQARGFRA